MSTHPETRSIFRVALLASVLTTAAVTALVLTHVISPEWFFGASAIGVVCTSATLAGRRLLPTARRRDVESAVERFERLQQRLRAENQVSREMEFEIERTLDLLEGKTERESAAEYLGHGILIPHLQEAEKQRVQAGELRANLLRERADAHARLLVTAREQGISDPGSRDPDELVLLISEAGKLRGRQT